MSALNRGEPIGSCFELVRSPASGRGERWLVRDVDRDEDVAVGIVADEAATETLERLRQECRNADAFSSPAATKTALRAILDPIETADRQVELTPPPPVAPTRPTGGNSIEARVTPTRRIPWGLLALFGVLLVTLYGVVFTLPRWAAKRQARERPATSADAGSSVVPAEVDQSGTLTAEQLESQDHFRVSAQQALARATELRKSLAARDADRWGGTDWTRGVEGARVGDEHLAATNYAGAAGAYAEAIRHLEAVESRAPEVFAQALAGGSAALDAGDSSTASAAFRRALAIDPANGVAAAGLERASVLDEVVRLLHAGVAAEHEGDLDLARDRYARAAQLDPMSHAAQQSLARVTDRISDSDFARAMSEGLAALTDRRYETAGDAFRRAATLRPGSSQVADALLRVEQAQQLDRILAHQVRARELEEQERWSEALAQYEAVLALDSAVRFAQEGSRRASARADLARRLGYHIQHPERFSTDAVYDEAELLLAQASELGEAGPRLAQQIAELRQRLDGAATRVRVSIESDRQTEVTVFKIGRLGRFERQELELRPGTYTVIGSREGYRDVRHRIVVEAGGPPVRVVVRCTEKI